MATAASAHSIQDMPGALWNLTRVTLDRAKMENRVFDIRFSKFPEPYKRLQFGKHYVVGFSGWLKVDPAVKRVFLTMITPEAEHLYCERGSHLTTIVKPSTDYEYSYDDANEIRLVRKNATVVKRNWFQSKDDLNDFLRGLKLHEQLDAKCPNGLSKAHVAHPFINRSNHPQGIMLESVQKVYQTSLYELYKMKVKPSQLVKPCLDVLDALIVMHQEGILHCDVKMGNILVEKVEQENRGRLTDFGLARRIGEDRCYNNGYRYWDRLAIAGIFHYFTDVYGMAITIGEIIWRDLFQELIRKRADVTIAALDLLVLQALQIKGLIGQTKESLNHKNPKVAVHLHLRKIIATVIADDERLMSMESELKTIEPAKRAVICAPHHISLYAFRQMVQELYDLVLQAEGAMRLPQSSPS